MRLSHLVSVAGLIVLVAGGAAQAYDHDRDHWRREEWRHEEWRREHRYDPRHEPRYVYERPVVVRERPVYVEQPRPVFVQPAPMYAAPMMPQSQGPSGLNLNFNIPLN